MAWRVELTTSDNRKFQLAPFGWSYKPDQDERVINYETRSEANTARLGAWRGRGARVTIVKAPANA